LRIIWIVATDGREQRVTLNCRLAVADRASALLLPQGGALGEAGVRERAIGLCGGYMLGAFAQAAADPPSVPAAHDVVVVGSAIAKDAGPPDDFASAAQRIAGNDLARTHARGVGEALAELGGSIATNDTQGSAFQPDVNFRGFSASPVLGTPPAWRYTSMACASMKPSATR